MFVLFLLLDYNSEKFSSEIHIFKLYADCRIADTCIQVICANANILMFFDYLHTHLHVRILKTNICIRIRMYDTTNTKNKTFAFANIRNKHSVVLFTPGVHKVINSIAIQIP